MTVVLLALTGLAAIGDWVAVDRRLFHLEYVLKPLTLALLLAAAATADLGPGGPWVVAGLAFGLAGDIGLMLAGETGVGRAFLLGLGSFLVGHVAYVVGFVRQGTDVLDLVAGALVVAGIAGLTLRRVLRGAAAAEGRLFAGVVAGYAAVLAVMTVLAVGTALVATAIGGVLFLVSDNLIAWRRFVAPVPRGALQVIVTYHLAQVLIVLGLVLAH